MANELAFEEIFSKYKADPFDYVAIHAVHTGRVTFKAKVGQEVVAPSGDWLQIAGTPLYEINRERNPRLVGAQVNGMVSEIHTELEGCFVEAGVKLMTIKHPLKKKEIIENILRDVLYLFPAPESAKYFFAMDIQSRIDKKGARAVSVEPGDEILTMSLMKRDTPIYYQGERGVIYSVYFKPGISVAQGDSLFGVCAPEKLPLIQKIITRVKAEWDSEH
jgi:hypothetical protein